MNHNQRHMRMCVAYAAPSLKAQGCKLEATTDGGWWVTVPDGATVLAEDWRDLAKLECEVSRGKHSS